MTNNHHLLDGQVAVVTGAASGIGRAVAERFVEEGARVVLGDVDEAGVAAVTASLRDAGGEAEASRLDVSSQES